jgi:hypothetical protein
LPIVTFSPPVAFVLIPAFGELDTAPHGADVTTEFPLAPLVLGDTQLLQLTLYSFASISPQPATGGFVATRRNVALDKLTVDPTRCVEFATELVYQPAKVVNSHSGDVPELDASAVRAA